MTFRTHFVLLACWLCGHLADGLYLKYKISPNVTELRIETTFQRNENARLPRDVGPWMHKNRKKLVVLDRKNKFVAAFIQKLINLIEKEKYGDKSKSISKLSNAQKIPCYRSFGHLYNSRYKKCGPVSEVTVKPILKVMTVVIPPETDNVFLDSTRHGFQDELDMLSNSDTERFSDMSDYTDDDELKPRAKIVQNLRRQGHPLYKASPKDSDDDSSKSEDILQTEKKSTRFVVVTNSKNPKNNHDQSNITSQSDSVEENVQSESDSDKDVQQNGTDSDQEQIQGKQDIFSKNVKAHDTDEETDSKTSDVDDWEPKTQQEKEPVKPNSSDELCSLEEDDSEEKRSKKKTNNKVTKQSDNYIYKQGPQPVNSDMETDGDTRRDGMNRLQNIFMPKRNIWDSREIQHLSYYWFNGPQGYVLYS